MCIHPAPPVFLTWYMLSRLGRLVHCLQLAVLLWYVTTFDDHKHTPKGSIAKPTGQQGGRSGHLY